MRRMRKAKIEEQNHYLLHQQHDFRRAADIVTDALMGFEEVEAVAVIGSVAKSLWKEIPRFREFRRERIEVWHECKDLDLAVWISSQLRLEALRRARAEHSICPLFRQDSDLSTGIVVERPSSIAIATRMVRDKVGQLGKFLVISGFRAGAASNPCGRALRARQAAASRALGCWGFSDSARAWKDEFVCKHGHGLGE